jgi:hypothetical protein
LEKTPAVKITEGFDEGQECFIITTPTTTYYYQKESGGFSSMHDRENIDWINFKATDYGIPGDAGGIYRGVPNILWPDNIGHPGHKKMQSKKVADHIIRSISEDGLWEWDWTFSEDKAKLDITKTAQGRTYWFLYEGTQGGRFDPFQSFWGTEKHGRRTDTPICHQGDPPPYHDTWKTVYFGLNGVPRILYARIHTDEAPLNLYSYMGSTEQDLKSPDGMTVFGFGRGPGPSPMLQGPCSFTIGFLETTDHDEVMAHLAKEG